MPKTSLKIISDTLLPISRGLTFFTGINLKADIIVRVDFELTYFKAVVQSQ